jgi:hypothetical protein
MLWHKVRYKEMVFIVAQGMHKEMVFTVGRRDQPDVVAQGTL